MVSNKCLWVSKAPSKANAGISTTSITFCISKCITAWFHVTILLANCVIRCHWKFEDLRSLFIACVRNEPINCIMDWHHLPTICQMKMIMHQLQSNTLSVIKKQHKNFNLNRLKFLNFLINFELCSLRTDCFIQNASEEFFIGCFCGIKNLQKIVKVFSLNSYGLLQIWAWRSRKILVLLLH